MTIKEVINQVYGLSINGYFNRERFSKTEFNTLIRTMFKNGNNYICEIALPDGWWYMKIMKLQNHEYDYYIPDTRDQEQIIIKQLYEPA